LSSTSALDRPSLPVVVVRWAKAKDVNLHDLDHLEHFA
jgi:hypothetical protein